MARCIALILLGTTPLSAIAAEDENWQRLRAMPREQRVILADRLRDFDRLPAAEKSAVRTLDAELSRRGTAEQAGLQSVLRRYHLWLQSLPEEKRKLLLETPPEQRMALVTRFHAEDTPQSSKRPTPVFLQLLGPSPYMIAQRLKLWSDLSPAERKEVEKQTDLGARQRYLGELIRKKKIRMIAHLLPGEEEDLLKKMEADVRLRDWSSMAIRKAEAKKSPLVKTHLAENYYFFLHPPKRVEPANLLRFESDMPPGFRSLFDHFPPEEAKRRLTILYRLVYPAPAEITAPKPSATPKAPTAEPKEGPRRAPPKPSGGAPPPL